MEILQGLREKPISNTPEDYIKIYTDCWNSEPDNRPTSNQVVEKLNEIILKENIKVSNEQWNIAENIKVSNEQRNIAENIKVSNEQRNIAENIKVSNEQLNIAENIKASNEQRIIAENIINNAWRNIPSY
ncbi:unnamed protein product [Rhizophagus irregularis]|uniref:Serine-threonine/tyrosine-protein kinase catalytic domain-containing protein n=1 Tax=Rhizophagus irregularis TaxID=588596 RepID=A0A915YWB8_9GLOM|nr:unnamed protein product [Rhizophagus irregularis]CAB5347485.1 unnamed protein product [Rhizophagus irregularis]